MRSRILSRSAEGGYGAGGHTGRPYGISALI
jgi:hypothetical protein